VRGLVDAVRRALPKDAPADSGPAIASQLVGALQLAVPWRQREGHALLKASRRCWHSTTAIVRMNDDRLPRRHEIAPKYMPSYLGILQPLTTARI